MNLNVAVVGAPAAGKSLFCINFAEYLGARMLCYCEEGFRRRGRGAVSPAEARRLIVDPGRRFNEAVRTFFVNLKHGRSPLRLALADTVSLPENNPLPRPQRVKLVLTLQSVHRADMVLYLADLSADDPADLVFTGAVGRLLEHYCHTRAKPFRAIFSKGDLFASAGDRLNWKKHLLAWENDPVLVSSVNRTGFPELRHLLLALRPHGR